MISTRVRKIAKGYSYIRHVCLSVRMEQLGSHWTDFHEILIFEYFSKICNENSNFLIWQE
jgi:hypothetical protein